MHAENGDHARCGGNHKCEDSPRNSGDRRGSAGRKKAPTPFSAAQTLLHLFFYYLRGQPSIALRLSWLVLMHSNTSPSQRSCSTTK